MSEHVFNFRDDVGQMISPKPRVLFLIGTRPEAIKLAPVVRCFRRANSCFEALVIATGQHSSLLDDVVASIDLKIDRVLDFGEFKDSLCEQVTKLVSQINRQIKELAPDFVIVHGDTSSAYAGAMAAFLNGVKCCHVEAGLRTTDVAVPFPEEYFRRSISISADFHFAPTKSSASNLVKEGKNHENIYITGNTVVDSIRYIEKFLHLRKDIANKTVETLSKLIGFDLRVDDFVLITCHRRENFGHNIQKICDSILALSEKFPHLYFVIPMHLNPSVRGVLQTKLNKHNKIILIEPQKYIEFTLLLKYCRTVITDSGGIQEEAPYFNKKVFILRDETERPEVVELGFGVLVGGDASRLMEVVSAEVQCNFSFDLIGFDVCPFGDGYASDIIYNTLAEELQYQCQ